jgi:DinB superfamily
MNDVSAGFVERLDAVEARLRALAPREVPEGALTAPDPPTGERWEAGQVWAHLAEFIPYWLGEAALVIEHGGTEPAAFGRAKSDPGRLSAIERDRRRDRTALWKRTAADVGRLRDFLVGLDATAWEARGRHPTLGEMSLARIVDEFLVGHLDQHALQLEELLS